MTLSLMMDVNEDTVKTKVNRKAYNEAGRMKEHHVVTLGCSGGSRAFLVERFTGMGIFATCRERSLREIRYCVEESIA